MDQSNSLVKRYAINKFLIHTISWFHKTGKFCLLAKPDQWIGKGVTKMAIYTRLDGLDFKVRE